MILLDIEKAFDVVWHEALVCILFEYHVPLYLILIIARYLKNRKFIVTANNAKSSKRRITAGVLQGSLLGPLLFLFCINNIPKNSDTELALFADDTAILASSWKKALAVKRAQAHLIQIIKFFHKWKIKINAAKTEIIIFSKKNKKRNCTAPQNRQ